MGGTTAGGLPYPSGTDPLRDGDDAIKALADALQARGAATKVIRGSATVTFDSAGRGSIPITGLVTLNGAIVQFVWEGNAPFVPMILAVEKAQTNSTKIGLWAAQSMASGSSWWNVPALIYWEAWGT